MHGGNWGSGSGAGDFGIGLPGNSASGIGSRAASDFNTISTTWREFFREMILVAGFIMAFLSIVLLVMVMNERYGMVSALTMLTIIIVLMIFSPRKE